MSTVIETVTSEIQEYLQANPREASTYRCVNCLGHIGDVEYSVSYEGIVRHAFCLRAALDLIKRNIEPGTDLAKDLHAAVQIIVRMGRASGQLPA